MEANKRLEHLQRRSAGGRLLPSLRKLLSTVLDTPPETLDFLPLDESDQIRQQASRSFPPRHELEARGGEYPFVSKRVRSTSRSHLLLPEGEGIFLMLPEADRVGVLRLSRTAMNRKWRELLAAKSDGFALVDAPLSNKLVLQLLRDEATQEDVFDVAGWGSEWATVVNDIPG
jgi:hypothetical protein